MNLSAQIAKSLRSVYTGGNWTSVNFKDVLQGLTWQQATQRVGAFNTIAALGFHTHYYIAAVLKVLKGGPLDAHDKFSFDLPPIQRAEDWESLLQRTWADAEELAGQIESFPEERLGEIFADPRYGTYYRNFTGIVEHLHYHLGQIVLIKKMVQEKVAATV